VTDARSIRAEVKRLATDGVRNSEIARRVGISHQRVHQIMTGYTSPSSASRRPPVYRQEAVLRYLATGLTHSEIAKTMGLSTHTINEYACRLYRAGLYGGRCRRQRTDEIITA
jgi:DNA-binding NarL/FixJ family response regulator